MTSDSMQQLRDLAQADAEVMAAIQAATTREDIVRIAGQHGIELDPAELAPVAELSDSEVDDSALEFMAGGVHPKYGTFTDITC